MSFPDESIRNVGERDSRKPFSPHFLRQQHHSLLVLEQHSPQELCEDFILKTFFGRGCLVVKATDSCLACHEFEPSTTEDPPCRGVDAPLIDRLKCPPIGIV
ncbi:hypothetical protein TNCV_449071 [Trichonephila clavipes]|nr:hypothetical protein TNCV_449071 [Trichonephila clavipes]